ncbi:hypothetical protein KIM372_07380 [Bombiscardovia nodaiensis]|uniref:Putative host cell surface-exposed lipoprotein Ltp-like HTH region domain-containing protein n=1 Tax=Bombiscardovia nodaiensis TaxID=2932181 RepID=A0ABM8B7I2_9BIFI|nr:hypothetical protein KIM372_07380 [Bombiscardovia nodaiensis]
MRDQPDLSAYYEEKGKPLYKRVWIWVLVAILAAGIYLAFTHGDTIISNAHEVIDWATKSEITKQKSPKPKPRSNNHADAAKKAQVYVDTYHLSEEGLRDKLTGEPDRFTDEAAQYAIEHVHADYPANALIRAKDYAQNQHLDRAAIDAKLTGIVDKFTPADANYALDHLND